MAVDTAELCLLFVKTLKRPTPLPTILSPEEVERLIASAKNLMHCAMLMTLSCTERAPGNIDGRRAGAQSCRRRDIAAAGQNHGPGWRRIARSTAHRNRDRERLTDEDV